MTCSSAHGRRRGAWVWLWYRGAEDETTERVGLCVRPWVCPGEPLWVSRDNSGSCCAGFLGAVIFEEA